jgi:hypothetical protein
MARQVKHPRCPGIDGQDCHRRAAADDDLCRRCRYWSENPDAPRLLLGRIPSGQKQTVRPATAAQIYRLNQLRCIKLVPIGEGEQIDFAVADTLLASAAAEGLWTPKRSRAD